MRPCTVGITLLAAVVVFTPTARPADPPAPAPTASRVDYNRDVRPVLSDNCFTCHGPDEKQRKAKLRLDTREGVLAVDKKELLARITSHDADTVMPPAKTGKKLTTAQIATLKAWVDQGATWSSHWAFTAPRRPAVPVLGTQYAVPGNPIDAFIRARLEAEGLKPSPPADKVTLIRRVTLDLTGLPPTPEEVDAFVKDKSPEAYEKVVDRLLASPRFGERMAWRWLEAARYADTNGYQTDAGRDMWRWRDWVIEAYNRNLPFDQFTTEQLAGDLLPNATLDQRIATGFNRNHRGNSEGGIVPEEYAVEYVADRVETTATVWLGLTFTCCRCHDHKFDPFPTKDFYRLFAFFNNVPEKGRAEKYGNSRPVIKAPTREQEKRLAELDAKVKAAEAAWVKLQPDVAKAAEAWAKDTGAATEKEWFPSRELQKSWSLDAPIVFDGEKFTSDAAAGNFGFDDRFSFAMWVSPLKTTGTLLSRGPDEPRAEGYSVELIDGKVRVSLTKRWLDDALRVETANVVEAKKSTHIAVTYDGHRLAAGVKVYVNGVPQKTTALFDELNQTFQNKEPFRIGAGGGRDNRYRGFMNDVLIYDRVLDAAEVAHLAEPTSVAKIIAKRSSDRTPGERAKLTACFMERHAPVDLGNPLRDLLRARAARQSLLDTIPTTMVMEEMPTPRDTHVLLRGEYDKKGAKVTPGTPTAITSDQGANAPRSPKQPNRLDLAKWVVSRDNPLTARVAVNRAWQMHFGVGLVKTAEDFGTQGAYPSHPELLDWLAVEFMSPANPDRKVGGEDHPDRKVGGEDHPDRKVGGEDHPDRKVGGEDHPDRKVGGEDHPAPRGAGSPVPWDTKRLHKLIVTSATYRQSSQITKESLAKDPENKLLARFPRLRLSSEMLRDQALFTSGLLVEKLGGASVKPYQPAGLWNELSGTGDYTPDKGEGLYRRSLYTYWKRTSPPPVMAAFDAAGRETCWVRENRTNTPLQALTLLNETAFVEAARVMAQRVMREAKTTDDRLTRAFRLATGRKPTDREMGVIRKSFDFQLAEFRKNPPGIQRLMAIGEAKPDAKLDPAELAAYATICNLLLNLDEVLTKE